VQMTAMKIARNSGTRRVLAAFIPATTTMKLASINSAGALAVRFIILFIDYTLTL
jgi:hypothetical protein